MRISDWSSDVCASDLLMRGACRQPSPSNSLPPQVIFKQYLRDQHRFERKKAKQPAKVTADNLQPPVLQLPPAPISLQEAVDYLPFAPLSDDKLKTVKDRTSVV